MHGFCVNYNKLPFLMYMGKERPNVVTAYLQFCEVVTKAVVNTTA